MSVASLALGLVAVGVARAPGAGAFPESTVNIVGHGFGHGRGMGQFGALGYALSGSDAPTILGHYYSNTSPGSVGAPAVTVDLSRADGQDTIVVQEMGHMHTSADHGAGSYGALRAARAGVNLFVVYSGSGASCSGGPAGWQPLNGGQPVTGPVVFSPAVSHDTFDPSTDTPRAEMLQDCDSTGARWYRGELHAVEGNGTSHTVNALAMDSYVRGVVPRESPASWGQLPSASNPLGMNALRAQAVAVRSYAAAHSSFSWAQICDTTACQVYGGRAVQDAGGSQDLEGAGIYATTSDQATGQTAGQVRMLNGAVASTEYSASTGGYTAGGAFPAVPDDGDATSSNPYHTWRAAVPVSQIEGTYPQIGTLQSVNVSSRNGLGDLGGRVLTVVVQGSNGSASITGPGFAAAFGLRSDWFAVTNNPTGGISGYWVGASDGGVFSFGSAAFYGSTGAMKLNRPIVGMTATPTGHGYWLVASDGGIFAFGDARFFGSTGAMTLNKPVVAMATTPGGNGYWLVASDGGIFAFGDARFFGSTGAMTLNKPVVGMAPTPDGNGYWLVASDGGIFAFGNAGFAGSTGCCPLNQPIVAMMATPAGRGYWLLAGDGGLFSFGDAGFFGSLPGANVRAVVAGGHATRTGGGYLMVTKGGVVYSFGDAPQLGSVPDQVAGYGGTALGIDVVPNGS